MIRLSVNVNKIALLRNQRDTGEPSVTRFCRIALDAGAAGITVHPRPDARHIRATDVTEIAQLLADPAYQQTDQEFNIEGNPFEGQYIQLVQQTQPDQCTLVPDSPDQATSDHGWDLTQHLTQLKTITAELHAVGSRVSLFMDPDPAQIDMVPDTGADRIELYTEPYAAAFVQGGSACKEMLARFAASAERAHALGLKVNAGHDLSLDNLGPFLQHVPYIEEVSIGHALTAEALEFGLANTVERYLAVISQSQPS